MGPAEELLPSAEEYLAEQVAKLGYASIEEVLAVPRAMPLARRGDPLRIGERVRLTLAYCTSFPPIGYVVGKDTPVYGGVAATTAGTVRTLGEPLPFLATVEWDDGYVQTIAIANLIQVDLLQNETIRFHAGMLS